MTKGAPLLLSDEIFEMLAPVPFKLFDRLCRHMSITIVSHNLELMVMPANRVFALGRVSV